MSQDNFNVLQPEALTDECLIAKKIYGRCKQQDCLKPTDPYLPKPPCHDGMLPPETPDYINISSSFYGGSATGTGLKNSTATGALAILGAGVTISYGQLIVFNNLVHGVKIVDGTFSTKITNITVNPPGQFCIPGFYDVTVQYEFDYNLNLLDLNNNPIIVNENGNNTATAIPAYTTYTKTISLEGGCVNPHTSIAIGDSCCCPCNIGSQPKNVPCAYVQAIANPLIEKVGKYLTAPGSTTFEYHADVVIGLFTIIELYRITSMTVASSGPIEVPQCQPSVINDPCVGFNQLLFPYDDFDPSYRKC